MPTSRQRRFTSGISALALVAGSVLLAPAALSDTAQSAEQPAPTTAVTSGVMEWGVKSSFAGYVSMPFAGGGWDMDGVTRSESSFAWPAAAGGEIDVNALDEIAFNGSVRFHAHDEVLDISFSNPAISFAGSSPVLTVEAEGRAFVDTTTQGELVDYGRVELATLSAPTVTEDEDSIALSFETATLTEDGVAAFGGFYEAGEALDSMSLTLQTETVETPVGPECGPDSAPADLSALPGYFSWGLNARFFGYLLSPAGGGTLSGCEGAWGANQLNYTLAEGTRFNPADPSTLNFVGNLNVNGHGGALNIDFSDPVVAFTDPSSAVLSLTASGSLRRAPGGWADNPVVVKDFARLGAIKTVENLDGSVTITSESVTSGEGTSYVLGAYPAGTELEPFSITVNASSIVSDSNPDPEPADPVDPEPSDPVEPGESADPVKPAPPAPVKPTPTEPVAPAQPAAIGKGALDWRVMDRFLDYVRGPIGQGDWAVSDGVTGTFRFPLAPGQNIDISNPGTVKFDGKVDFRAHHDQLRIVVSKPTIEKSGNSWELTADVASRNLNSTSVPGALPAQKRIVLANLSAPETSRANGVSTLTFKSGKLTPAGAEAFGGFYDAGEPVAPITVSFAEQNVALPPVATPVGNNSSGGSAGGSAGGPAGVTAPPATVPTIPFTEELVDRSNEIDPTKTRVTSGSLQWGVRQSFTTYIRSAVADGGWATSGGVSWNGSTFVFPARGGLYDTASRTGELHYGGTINFSGHDDLLRLTMSNPSIVINGNSASLYLSVQSSQMDGVMTDHGRVHFANITLSNVQSSNSSLSFTTSSVALTPAGAASFAGFYDAGVQLSPMTASASLTPATVFDEATGELKTYNAFGSLAYTGASSTGLALGAGILILMGLTAVRLRRITA